MIGSLSIHCLLISKYTLNYSIPVFCNLTVVRLQNNPKSYPIIFRSLEWFIKPTVKPSCPGHRPQSVNTDCLLRLRVVASKIEVTVSGQGGT